MDKNKKDLDIPFLTVKNVKDLRYSQDSIGDTYGGHHPLYANRKLSDVADILREEGTTDYMSLCAKGFTILCVNFAGRIFVTNNRSTFMVKEVCTTRDVPVIVYHSEKSGSKYWILFLLEISGLMRDPTFNNQED